MEKLPISKVEPNFISSHGKYWELDNPDKEKFPATLKTFIIHCPAAHPMWSNYALMLIDLNDYELLPPVVKYKDQNVTHEMFLFALNPQHEPTNDAEHLELLTPMNFGAQFIAENDDAAIQRIRETVTMICNGVLSPDTDYRHMWIALFGDSNIKTGC